MKSGELKHRIKYQTKTNTEDSSGSFTESWTDAATVWAKIRPISGREYTALQQTQSEMSHEVTIRWRAGVDTAGRFLFGTRVFDIEAVSNLDEGNVWLVCRCVERTA